MCITFLWNSRNYWEVDKTNLWCIRWKYVWHPSKPFSATRTVFMGTSLYNERRHVLYHNENVDIRCFSYYFPKIQCEHMKRTYVWLNDWHISAWPACYLYTSYVCTNGFVLHTKRILHNWTKLYGVVERQWFNRSNAPLMHYLLMDLNMCTKPNNCETYKRNVLDASHKSLIHYDMINANHTNYYKTPKHACILCKLPHLRKYTKIQTQRERRE